MTQRTAEQFVEEIIDLFLAIPEGERENIIRSIKCNSYFCFECGYGSRIHLNGNCQCWNDE